jgi:hypothetical protein
MFETHVVGADELAADLKRVAEDFPDIWREEAKTTLTLIAARYESEIVQRTPAGVGGSAGLRGSIAADAPKVSMTGASVAVGSPLEYAEPVEYGRKPGKQPPVEPLALWARRKLGIPKEEADGVGFAIARRIALKGTDGAFMFRDAWKAIEGWADGEADKLPNRIAEKGLNGLK